MRQIVGGSLGENTCNNFISDRPAAYYARRYREDGLRGGHIVLLDKPDTPGAAADRLQALAALAEFPGGLQIGGGIHPGNAADYLNAGASHVIVTSYVFEEGRLSPARLDKLRAAVGKDRLVLDFSARLRDGKHFIVTNRWRDFTDLEVTPALLRELSDCCGEFLVHAVDVEGKKAGIDERLVEILAASPIPATYAGGVADASDAERIGVLGGQKVDFTVGSALDLFGGNLSYRELVARYHQ